MEIIIGVAVFVFFAMMIAGKLIGPPKPQEMTVEAMLNRIYSESNWIIRYQKLDFNARESSGIKKQYLDKEKYINDLQNEIINNFKKGGASFMEPVVTRQIYLIRNGTPVSDANILALQEIIAADPTFSEKLKNL
jgi:hypothetical protein